MSIDVLEGQTVSLICGINRKGDLFIEPDLPQPVLEQQDPEDQHPVAMANYWSSIWMLLRVLRWLVFPFFHGIFYNISCRRFGRSITNFSVVCLCAADQDWSELVVQPLRFFAKEPLV
jgi:hypothetical protein